MCHPRAWWTARQPCETSIDGSVSWRRIILVVTSCGFLNVFCWASQLFTPRKHDLSAAIHYDPLLAELTTMLRAVSALRVCVLLVFTALLPGASAILTCRGEEEEPVLIDFSQISNPSIGFEWADAAGQLYTGSWSIPSGATDATGGALPGGFVRWKNVGIHEGVEFDLVVSAPTTTIVYSDVLQLDYVSPVTGSQAASSSAGFACLGLGVKTAVCPSGASLTPSTARCSDGTPTTLQGAEFDFSFRQAGSTQLMKNFTQFYVTFYGV